MNKKTKATAVVFPAVGAVIIALCSMLTVPSAVPFTLQTFGVFSVLLIFGAKYGNISIIVYLALGALGVPIFSGFKGGVSALFGVTGGYLLGFLLLGLCYLLITKLFGGSLLVRIIALSLGLIICYAFGTAWFVAVYSKTSGEMGMLSALSVCVFPFIIPDAIKMALAFLLCEKLKPRIKFLNYKG